MSSFYLVLAEKKKRYKAHESLFGTYVNAIFFAAQVATTVGYGSTFPVSNNGKIFVSVFILVGVPITGHFAYF